MAQMDFSWVGDIGNAIGAVAYKMPELVQLDEQLRTNKRYNEEAFNQAQSLKRGLVSDPETNKELMDKLGANNINQVKEYLDNVLPQFESGEDSKKYTLRLAKGIQELSQFTNWDPDIYMQAFRKATDPSMRATLKQAHNQSMNYKTLATLGEKAMKDGMSLKDFTKALGDTVGPDGQQRYSEDQLNYYMGKVRDSNRASLSAEWADTLESGGQVSTQEMRNRAIEMGLGDDPEIKNAIRLRNEEAMRNMSSDQFEGPEDAINFFNANDIDQNSAKARLVIRETANKKLAQDIASGLLDLDMVDAEEEGGMSEALDVYMRDAKKLNPEVLPYLKDAVATNLRAKKIDAQIASNKRDQVIKGIRAEAERAKAGQADARVRKSDLIKSVDGFIKMADTKAKAYNSIANDKSLSDTERANAKIKKSGAMKVIAEYYKLRSAIANDEISDLTTGQLEQTAGDVAGTGELEAVKETGESLVEEKKSGIPFFRSVDDKKTAKATAENFNERFGSDGYKANQDMIEFNGTPVAQIIDGEISWLEGASSITRQQPSEAATPQQPLEAFDVSNAILNR